MNCPFSGFVPAGQPDVSVFAPPMLGDMLSDRPLLGGCLPAGWPAADRARRSAWEALADSVGLVEVALPTPWPYLDGKTMRNAYVEALDGGYRHGDAVDLVGRLVDRGAAVIVMAYWHTLAADLSLAGHLARAGAAGIVIPDLPAASACTWSDTARAIGLHTILLAASANPGDLAMIARFATGAVYVPAADGPTGTGGRLRNRLADKIGQVRKRTGLPVITGIGITSPARAAEAARSCPDAIIAGSVFIWAVAGAADPAAAIRSVAGRFAWSIGEADGRKAPRADLGIGRASSSPQAKGAICRSDGTGP
jgi:tryptophan synthase alpha chain